MSSRVRIPCLRGATRLAARAVALAGLVAVGALSLPTTVEAQPRPVRPDGPGHYAITGATVVTVSGATIRDGTVVVRDGIIQAVGSDVQIPAGAWVIDGSGKTVYPGLIDGMTNLGHPSSVPVRGGGFFGGGQDIDEETHSWGPEDRPGTHTWMKAADDLDGNDDRIAAWRLGGFTSAVSAFGPGIVTGQAAFLNLTAADRPQEMVVKTPVGLRLNLRDRSYTGYPNSLLGDFAYLKQLYFDAAHYDAVWTDYEADPVGKTRPEWDRALEPLRTQIAEGWPVFFPGQDRKEIARAIATSEEMGVRPIVYGAQGAYAAADLLAARGVPALIDLDWPEAPRNADPEADPSLETLRFWERAATTPARLAAAGVPFAFFSGGMSDPGEVLSSVRKSVALGLSPEDAIRALTLSAAEIFGVADRVGSIQPGKIANLVLADGDLFEAGTRVETVFVDGVKFDAPEEVASARPNGSRGARGGAGDGGAGEDDFDTDLVPMAQDRGPYRSDPVTLIRGATILTASQGTIENGDVLIRDGKIAEVGTDLTAPSGARIVDGEGKFVTPGIIDAHSHMAADAINEGAVNVSSMVGIKDVLDPNDVGMYRALAGGVTAINVLHGSANPIGGKNAVLKMKWGADAADLIIPGSVEGIKFALGENTKRDRNPPRYPSTRMGVQDVVRQAFLDASYYQAEWDEWEAGGRQGIEPRRDLKLEALAEILRGDRLVHAHSYRADEILQLIRLAEEYDFTLGTFQHVLEGYKVADEIAAHGAGASTFSDWWAYKVEAYDAIPYNAALMAERGVLVSINSDSGEEIRHLNQEAAKAMKWGGMDEQSALRLVTLNPAIQLEISDHTGSIDVGKDADLAIFDGHPLSMFAKVLQTYVDGDLYFDIDLDQERQAAIEAEKAALLEKHVNAAAGSGVVTEDMVAPGREEAHGHASHGAKGGIR